MKILIAGGGGYIGSRLIPQLLSDGHIITIIDLFWFGCHLPIHANLNCIKKNLFDCTEKDLEGYDQFIFLAGVSNDPMAEFSPSKNFVYNSALPSYLAFIAKKVGISRFIYASSCSVYGYTEGHDVTENDIPNSIFPYGISKLQGEKGVTYLSDNKFSTISLRQGTVCGYSPRMRLDLVLNVMTKNALLNKKLVVNNPTINRPILDIRDCVQAYQKSIIAPLDISGTFNVASRNYNLLEIGSGVATAIEEKTGSKIELEVKNEIVDLYRNYRVDISQAKFILNFNPKYTEISNTVLDILDNICLNDVFNWNDDQYYNIKVFSKLDKSLL